MHLHTFTLGAHRVRVCVVLRSRGGCYSPALWIYLRGPNGSPAGVGPKGWPRVFRPLFPSYNGRRDRWSHMLHVPLPHVPFRTARRLRHVGGFLAYRACYRAWAALER